MSLRTVHIQLCVVWRLRISAAILRIPHVCCIVCVETALSLHHLNIQYIILKNSRLQVLIVQ